MVLRTLIRFSGAKRIPVIKFRKGGYDYSGSGSKQASANTATSASPTASPVPQAAAATSSNAIEDWELPPRFWRKPIDPVEMEYINRGGPA